MAYDNEACKTCIGVADTVLNHLFTIRTARQHLDGVLDIVTPAYVDDSGATIDAVTETPQEHGVDIADVERERRKTYYEGQIRDAVNAIKTVTI